MPTVAKSIGPPARLRSCFRRTAGAGKKANQAWVAYRSYRPILSALALGLVWHYLLDELSELARPGRWVEGESLETDAVGRL